MDFKLQPVTNGINVLIRRKSSYRRCGTIVEMKPGRWVGNGVAIGVHETPEAAGAAMAEYNKVPHSYRVGR